MIGRLGPTAVGLATIVVLVACGDDDDTGFDPARACRAGERLLTAVADGAHSLVDDEVENLRSLAGIERSDLDIDAIAALTDEDLDRDVADDVAVELDAIGCELT